VWGRAEVTEGLTSRLLVQNHAQEATMNRQPAVVVDTAKLLELLHEMTDPQPGCAGPLRQTSLILSRMSVSARLSFPK
jgi:hypothetical protein